MVGVGGSSRVGALCLVSLQQRIVRDTTLLKKLPSLI